MLALSWVAAIVSCLGYGVGSVLQAAGARRVAGVAGLSGIALIAVQLPYLLGIAADAIAFLANVVALQRLPLFLVQAILTGSVGVTAVIAAIRGEKLSRKGWSSLVVLGAGLVLLSVTAVSGKAIGLPRTGQWLVLGSAAIPLVTAVAGLRLRGHRSAITLAAAAGLSWTAVAIASRGLRFDGFDLDVLTSPLLWTIILQGVLGAACFALALQRGSVTAVTAITFILELVLPSGFGVWQFGDTLASGRTPVAALGFVLTVGGTIFLIRFGPEPSHDDLAAPGPRSDLAR